MALLYSIDKYELEFLIVYPLHFSIMGAVGSFHMTLF